MSAIQNVHEQKDLFACRGLFENKENRITPKQICQVLRMLGHSVRGKETEIARGIQRVDKSREGTLNLPEYLLFMEEWIGDNREEDTQLLPSAEYELLDAFWLLQEDARVDATVTKKRLSEAISTLDPKTIETFFNDSSTLFNQTEKVYNFREFLELFLPLS